ncbi:MAG: hypothetical protein AB7S44_00600 [Spirochaetales bacterium]
MKKHSFIRTKLLYILIALFVMFVLGFSSSIATAYAEDVIIGALEDYSTTLTNDTTNLTKFVIKNNDQFYFTDTTNSKVIVWNNGTLEEFGSFGAGNGSFVNPSLIATLPNNKIYVYDNLKRLQEFDSSYTFLNSYNIVRTSTTYIAMGSISSISNDLSNNLYMIDYDNDIIIKKSSTTSELTEYLNGTSLGLNFGANSQIAVSPNGATIFVTNINGASNIYSINNLLSINQIDIASYPITNVSQIAIDCANNLFVLDKNAISSKLFKLSRNTYAYESYLYVVGNALNNLTSLNINIESGQVMAINTSTNTLQNVNVTDYESNFTENITSFVDPIDYTLATALSSYARLASVSVEGCPLLQTPYNITPIIELSEGQKLIILSQTVDNNPDYYYVLYVNAGDDYNIDGYVLKNNITTLTNTDLGLSFDDVRILNNATNIYKYPTSLNSNLDTPVVVTTIDKNEELEVLGTAYDIIDGNGQSFYEVKITTNTIGYIRAIDAVRVTVTTIVPTISTNAEIVIPDNSSYVNVYSSEGNLNTLLPQILLSGQRIYISVYNKDALWTQVTFVDPLNRQVTGYIETKYIEVYDDYNNLLQAFLLTVISFVLIVIVIIVKTRKKPIDDDIIE